MSSQTQVKLPDAVAQKYALVDYRGGDTQNWGKHGVITISTMTIDQADRLVKNKWPKLKVKEPAASPAKTTKGE